MKTTLAAVEFYFACAFTISAQTNRVDPPLGTTTVSGHVFCADTNAPARMATVVLEPSDVIESIKPGEQLQANFSGEAVETLLDGSFIIHNDTPGTYYVIASKQGYIYPVAPLYIGGGQPSLPEDRRKEEPKLAPRIDPVHCSRQAKRSRQRLRLSQLSAWFQPFAYLPKELLNRYAGSMLELPG